MGYKTKLETTKQLKPVLVNGWWLHTRYNYRQKKNALDNIIANVGSREDDDSDTDYVGVFPTKEKARMFVRTKIARGPVK